MQSIHDVLILGAGFGGSLLAAILQRHGMRVALVDRQSHPRFAIGESSTPLADQTLYRIARRFHLPELLPLTSYGTWKRQHPELMCGLKRGFTYFGHETGRPFSPEHFADRRLLVAASGDAEHSDTHWLRSHVDQFFFQLARNSGARCLLPCRYHLSEFREGWQLHGTVQHFPVQLRSPFVIDATGSSNAVLRHARVPDVSHSLRTRSRAVYAHFAGVERCESVLQKLGMDTSKFPYPCDAAAVHHILRDGWMWQLRFDDDTVSAGLMIDQRREAPGDSDQTGECQWDSRVQQVPFLEQQFRSARLCRPRGGLQSAAHVQRLAAAAAGERWAALPNTVGFIDPLHSTGIAHTLICVERLADQLLPGQSGNPSHAVDWAHQYSVRLLEELRMVDELVEGCYAALPDFQLWCDWTMLYFAAVTSMEQPGGSPHLADAGAGERLAPVRGFLRADDRAFRDMLREARVRLGRCSQDVGETSGDFRGWLRSALEPWNHVGLLDDAADGLYVRTAAPVRADIV